MLAVLRQLVPIVIPVFVISTMLNVGLTQKPQTIIGYLANRPFVIRMVLANFVAVPLLMVVLLRLVTLDPALEAGLLIFSLGAGAPFLIKLTQRSEHHVALGAAVMMLLMVLSVVYMPIVLSVLLGGMTVDAGAVARSLLVQMLLPIAVGMVVSRVAWSLASAAQPWIARLSNIALYVVLAATLLGYLPNMLEIVGTGAILIGLVVIAAGFGFGYLAGHGKDHLEDVGGLGTAQRNTAAGLIVAAGAFTDPNVLVVITLVNTLGIVLLLLLARTLRHDNEPRPGTARPVSHP
jgi:bile acid:Na+ symporter, BASS family